MTYRVEYWLATYHGFREVNAEDAEIAVAKVKGWARRQMSLPMYYESYKVVGAA